MRNGHLQLLLHPESSFSLSPLHFLFPSIFLHFPAAVHHWVICAAHRSWIWCVLKQSLGEQCWLGGGKGREGQSSTASSLGLRGAGDERTLPRHIFIQPTSCILSSSLVLNKEKVPNPEISCVLRQLKIALNLLMRTWAWLLVLKRSQSRQHYFANAQINPA